MYTSLGVHLRTLPPAFAERCRVFAELWWGLRNLCGVCRTPRGVRTRSQNPVWGSVNSLGFGCLRLTFCGFDKLPLTLGGVLTDRCTHTILRHLQSGSTITLGSDAHSTKTATSFQVLFALMLANSSDLNIMKPNVVLHVCNA